VARILHLDDDDTVRTVCAVCWQREGHAVEGAGFGEDALRHLIRRDGAFDLFVTDVVHPGTPAVDLLDHVRQEWPWVRTLVLTARDAPVREGIRCDVVLKKPFTRHDLIETTRRLLGDQRARERTDLDVLSTEWGREGLAGQLGCFLNHYPEFIEVAFRTRWPLDGYR